MKVLLSIIEGILLSFSILITMFSITLFNKNYIKYEMNKYDYYNTIVDRLKDKAPSTSIDINEVKYDVNNYIDSYYEDKIYSSKIKSDDNNDYTNVYNAEIRFIGPFKNIKMYRDIFDICVLLFIILTGIVFVKTKNKHNINLILIISGIIGIIVAGVIYINNNYTDVVYKIINDSYHLYLAINIFIFLLPIFSIMYKCIVNKAKINT